MHAFDEAQKLGEEMRRNMNRKPSKSSFLEEKRKLIQARDNMANRSEKPYT